MSKITFLFLVLFSNFIWCQNFNSDKIKGKIIANTSDLDGIYIFNKNTSGATVTEKNGYFQINASVGDSLFISAVNLKSIKVKLKTDDFSEKLFFVKMEVVSFQLDEVVIDEYKNINSVSLGILSKPAKVYTPAERRLRAAGELHWYSPLLIPVGGMSIDGMLNAISGRTKMLKKELVVERKEFMLQKINNYFEESYFIEILKIPPDFIKGFQYYIVEDDKFARALKEKNKVLARFYMNELAVKYLELIKQK